MPTCSMLALLALPTLMCIGSAEPASANAPNDSRGVDGFAICGTLDPTSSYYVPGDPVYISEIFEVRVNSPNYELAFKNFLKQKYGWNKYVACSVSYTRDGAAKTFNERLEQAGAKLVRTGWTLASAGASAGTAVAAGAGSSSAPALAPDAAAGSSFWVCRVSGSDGKDYNSDIFRGSDGGFSKFPAVFGEFVQSKYKVKFRSSPTCTNYGVLGQQQAQEALKGFASYSTGVMTGWKYGMAAALSSAPSQPAAAPASSAQNAGGQMYWVCTWAYRKSYYVSDAFGADYPAVGPGQLVPAFQDYVVAKYGAKPYGGSCVYKFSEADAQALLQHELSAPQSGTTAVATGWRYGMTASAGSSSAAGAAAAAPHAAPEPSAAPAQGAPAAPVTTGITVRLVDAVNSSSDQTGKHYRAVVTQAATAGGVRIPVNTLAAITLVQQPPGNFSAQLVSLKLNGQDTPVTSTSASATSAPQQVAKKLGGLLSSIGKPGAAAHVSSAVSTAGARVAIPPGTSLTFSTSVPQPGAPAASSVPAPQAVTAAPAPSPGNELPNGELGPDGQVIGGTASGILTAYSCYAQTVPPGQHRQTSYVTAPFTSAQPQRWITFWFSQYIHQAYDIPANVARFTIDCGSLGHKTPAQQQAMVNANITSWKQHDNDVVPLNWVPTQTPTPGISVAQLNPMTGQMTTAGIGSNLQVAKPSPPGYVLCTTNRSYDNKAYTSAVFKGRSEEHLAIEQAFLIYLATTFGPNVPHNASCQVRAELADAQSYLSAMKNQAPGAGIKVVETGWTYSGATPVAVSSSGGSAESEQSTASGGQYVLCYSDTYEGSFYFSANFHIDVPPPPDPHSTQTDNGRSANALNELKADFLAFLKKRYGFRVTSAYPVYCDGDPTSAGPDERRQRLQQRFPQLKTIETGWKPGAAPAPAAANAATAPVNPYRSVGGVYTGTYACAKGPIDMTLTLALNESSILNGTMTFYLPPGSHNKAYTFSLGGPLNQTTGSFNLRPIKWETAAPPNYVLVGLIGTVNPQTARLSGTVDYSGCGKFEAMKGRED